MFDFGKKTYIMGILNVTPDSFSDGGEYYDIESALKQAKEMVVEGADIIDVGGESTRPGAKKVSVEDELSRIKPVIKRLVEELEVPISVDTYKPQVARAALEIGAHIINDVWGLQWDGKMAEVVAQYGVPVVIMHNQDGTEYNDDIIVEMKKFLAKSIKMAKEAGVEDKDIILDPGIGFGKTSEQNVEVMGRLSELKDLGYPILLGTSRKSMIGNILDLPPKKRVEGTLATTVMGIMHGVDIVRVHDVKENLRAALVSDAIVRGWDS
ncbi:dihydropteroate synthase [Halonatronum saccharophilum]|uniref:dihydropteroate synthase n=1 Tax=Halonatronum saccharophilum TaxID=150060 RepID=UPI0004874AE4|nr:dihydropteroate synthase [Halonatronum saccharophilum]